MGLDPLKSETGKFVGRNFTPYTTTPSLPAKGDMARALLASVVLGLSVIVKIGELVNELWRARLNRN